nr:MAG TPA: hypothetical protein [Bacteriophage sp.]
MRNGSAVTVVLRAVILSHVGKSFNLHGIVTKIMDGYVETAKTEK